jgi:hypothetical protein
VGFDVGRGHAARGETDDDQVGGVGVEGDDDLVVVDGGGGAGDRLGGLFDVDVPLPGLE